MGVNQNSITRTHGEAARLFAIPGVIRASRPIGSILLSRRDLKIVLGLSEREASGYGDPVGLGYSLSRPVVAVGNRRITVSEVKARLAEAQKIPPERKIAPKRRSPLQRLFQFGRRRG